MIKEVTSLKETKEGNMGGRFEGRKGNGKLCNYIPLHQRKETI